MEKRAGLTKIIRHGDTTTICSRGFDDIQAEHWGVLSVRPLVYLSDAHEAIEKSLWCYLNNMVPLIGEKDPDLTARLAAAYEIDSIIADRSSLELLLTRFIPSPGQLIAISLVGVSFKESACATYRRYANRFRLVQTDTSGATVMVRDI